MQTHRTTKWQALSSVLMFCGATILGYTGAATIAGAAVATYAVGKTMVCTPIAAFKASDPTRGFGSAFEDCWSRPRGSQKSPSSIAGPSIEVPAAQSEQINQPSTDAALQESQARASAV